MYCNSCLKQIPVDKIVYCKECGVPLHADCANHCLDCGAAMCDDCYKENHYRCSDCVTADKSIKSIRRSYIKQYEDCPYSFYLQVVSGIVPPMSGAAELGIIVHELIEKMQKKEINLTSAKMELEGRVEEWNISAEDDYSIISLDLLNNGKHCLDVLNVMLPSFNDDFLTEYKIEYSVDDKLPLVNCTVDRISFVGDSIHIHDWKTGKPMAGKQLIKDLQPPIYIYGVYKEFRKMPKTFTLHYLNAEKNLTYTHIGEMKYEVKTSRSKYILDVEDAIERTKTILTDIKKNKFEIIDDKEHLWRCDKMCWFGISGECESFQTEGWKRKVA